MSEDSATEPKHECEVCTEQILLNERLCDKCKDVFYGHRIDRRFKCANYDQNSTKNQKQY